MAPGSVRALARVRGPGQVQALEQVPVPAPARGRATSLTEQSGWVRRFHNLTLRWPQSPEIPLIAKSVERWTKCSPLTLLKGKFFSHPRGVHLVQRKTHTQTDERCCRPINAGDQESVRRPANRKWIATTVESDRSKSEQCASQESQLPR